MNVVLYWHNSIVYETELMMFMTNNEPKKQEKKVFGSKKQCFTTYLAVFKLSCVQTNFAPNFKKKPPKKGFRSSKTSLWDRIMMFFHKKT